MADTPDPKEDKAAYGFNRQNVKRISRTVLWAEKVRKNLGLPRTRYGGGLGLRIAKTGASGICARSGLTLGSATVDLYDSDDDGLLSDSGDDATAYNFSGTAIAASKYITVVPFLDGYLTISVEC